ncbi:transcriptional regulator BetI [Acinetobacter pollinis]|uniref:transcriptional regulator BetI n=1 Tax=Acinetobacter pollinis TaxID=2605270 RepID=UPI0018A253D8|nr:transcriptional regulator BetI [Acinetobacter pollinis]MBF7690431.1 transcriptional regulator BetI [Acinetobacter pollinis]MBF7692573.1 transcriptional regulator BetI [Acinetobacter pollinis]MBF7697564.1 transcriptional regulator BetI [Acinetobacter pollinis]MBF7699611.1 transcriptional regulator BetI [Acinetobacter pollinis]
MNTSRVKPEHVRREQIINASFDVIYELGLTNTTIAKIAAKAGLSTGIVSHYFGDKQGLINACMRAMLNELRIQTEQYRENSDKAPAEIIKAIIDSNFDASQTSAKAMRLWLEFWVASLHTPELQRLQRVNDQRLYSNLRYYFLKLLPKQKADIAARGMAALIDGLWLRGSLMSYQDTFDAEQARHIAYNYLNTHIKLQEIES